MKVLSILKKILFAIITVVFFAFVIVMTILFLYRNKYGVTEIGGYSLIMINDDVASENYTNGDLVIVQKKKIDKLKINDEVFAYVVADDGSVSIDFGYINGIDESQGDLSFVNGATYSIEHVAGTPYKSYDKLGLVLSIIGSKWGFLFTVLVPSFIIFIYQVYALVIEIKFGGKDEKPSKVENNRFEDFDDDDDDEDFSKKKRKRRKK